MRFSSGRLAIPNAEVVEEMNGVESDRCAFVSPHHPPRVAHRYAGRGKVGMD
jgi:hypothetical protein